MGSVTYACTKITGGPSIATFLPSHTLVAAAHTAPLNAKHHGLPRARFYRTIVGFFRAIPLHIHRGHAYLLSNRLQQVERCPPAFTPSCCIALHIRKSKRNTRFKDLGLFKDSSGPMLT